MTEIMFELSDFGSSNPKTKVSNNMKTKISLSMMFFRSLFPKASYPLIGTVADIGKRIALVNLHSTSRRPLQLIATVLFSISWD